MSDIATKEREEVGEKSPMLEGDMSQQIIDKIAIISVGQGGYKGAVEFKNELKAYGFTPSILSLVTSTTDAPDATNKILVGGDNVDGTGGDRIYSNEIYEDTKKETQGVVSTKITGNEPDMVLVTGTMGGGSGSVAAMKVAAFIDSQYPHIPCTLMAYKPISSLEKESPGKLSNSLEFIKDLSVYFDDPNCNFGVQICDVRMEGGSVSKGYRDSNISVARNFAMALRSVELARFYEYGGIDTEDYYNKFLLGGKASAFITASVSVESLSSQTLIDILTTEKYVLTGAGKAMPNVLVVAKIPEEQQDIITKAKTKLDSYLGTGVNSDILFSVLSDGETEASISIIITGGALPVAWVDSIESILTRHKVLVEDRVTKTSTIANEAAASSSFVKSMQTNRRRRVKVRPVVEPASEATEEKSEDN